MDMELRRFERRYQRELLGAQIGVDSRIWIYAWIWIDAWIRVDARIGIHADASQPGRSCIFRRLQNANRLQGPVQLRLVW